MISSDCHNLLARARFDSPCWHLQMEIADNLSSELAQQLLLYTYMNCPVLEYLHTDLTDNKGYQKSLFFKNFLLYFKMDKEVKKP